MHMPVGSFFPLAPVATSDRVPPFSDATVIYPAGSTRLVTNGFSATGFIPEIWSGKLIEKFYDSTVLAAISNTDY
jgi:hypothetical protein